MLAFIRPLLLQIGVNPNPFILFSILPAIGNVTLFHSTECCNRNITHKGKICQAQPFPFSIIPTTLQIYAAGLCCRFMLQAYAAGLCCRIMCWIMLQVYDGCAITVVSNQQFQADYVIPTDLVV